MRDGGRTLGKSRPAQRGRSGLEDEMNDRSKRALQTIGVATSATLVIYGLIRWLWVLPVADMESADEPLGWRNVLIATLLAGFAAWGVYAMLHRAGRERWWPFVGSTALAISVIGPSYLADGASAVALIVLHFVAAFVLIVGFARLDAVTACEPAARRG